MYGHVSAIAPARDANALAVHKSLAKEVVDSEALIRHLLLAELTINRRFESMPAARRPAIFELPHQISAIGKRLLPIDRLPLVANLLHAGPAIHVHDKRIFDVFAKIRRLDQSSIQH